MDQEATRQHQWVNPIAGQQNAAEVQRQQLRVIASIKWMIQGLVQIERVVAITGHLQGEHHRARCTRFSGQGIAEHTVDQRHTA